jgi:xanthine/uracil permease
VKAAPAFSAVLLPEPFWRLAVALLVGTTSGVVLAWMQTMPHTDTFVKNKTLTLPQAFLWRDKL